MITKRYSDVEPKFRGPDKVKTVAVVMNTYIPLDNKRDDGKKQDYLENIHTTLKCHNTLKSGFLYDLWVVDNGSPNKEWLSELGKRELKLQRENTGMSFAAYEHGYYHLHKLYTHYLFHEQDVAPTKDGWLKEIVEAWESYDIGFLGNTIERNTGARGNVIHRKNLANLDGHFYFSSRKILDECGFSLEYSPGRASGNTNEVRFVQPVLEAGYAIGALADESRTAFWGTDTAMNGILEPLEETIMPLVTLHARKYPEINTYFRRMT